MTFPILQQQEPVSRNGEWHANLVRVGTVQAATAELALAKARVMGLARFPIVGNA